MTTVGLIISCAMLVFVAFMMLRNNQVCDFRINLLHKVSNVAINDIEHGRDWKWRYVKMQQVSYGRMLFQFWRRLESFYDMDQLLGTYRPKGDE